MIQWVLRTIAVDFTLGTVACLSVRWRARSRSGRPCDRADSWSQPDVFVRWHDRLPRVSELTNHPILRKPRSQRKNHALLRRSSQIAW